MRDPPSGSYNPGSAAHTCSYADPVWALPRSLAATQGILSFPRGTEMFQFPRFPPGYFRVTSHHACRVAPFGDLWITGCQRLPRAFRRVATSFIGVQRQGIHRVPIIPVAPFVSGQPPSSPRSPPGHRSKRCSTTSSSANSRFRKRRVRYDGNNVLVPRRQCRTCRPRDPCSSFKPTRLVPGGPIFNRPIELSMCMTGSGAAGARTPNLRRARAALSRLSYDPRIWAGGRTWTRTRDLGLIRAAL